MSYLNHAQLLYGQCPGFPKMKVILPVAGKGTRMRPFTHTKPKPILPVAGKPIIDYLIDLVLPLKPTEIVFVTGHLKDDFESHIKDTYPDMKCSFVEQKTQRGTADAIWTAKDAFDEPVLIIFTDAAIDADMSVIEKCDHDGIIWGMKVKDPERFGVIVTDKEGYATKIVEKPKEFVSDLANIGMYYIKNTKLLAEGIKHSFDVATDEVWLTDAFAYMIEKGSKLSVPPVIGWYDCGKTDITLETNKILLDKRPEPFLGGKDVEITHPVSIHKTAQVEGSKIGPYVSIGPHVVVKNSSIKDAIIDEHSIIEDSKLKHSIIGRHASVMNHKGKLLLGDHSSLFNE